MDSIGAGSLFNPLVECPLFMKFTWPRGHIPAELGEEYGTQCDQRHARSADEIDQGDILSYKRSRRAAETQADRLEAGRDRCQQSEYTTTNFSGDCDLQNCRNVEVK